jgi:alanine-synthesizing transaminase
MFSSRTNWPRHGNRLARLLQERRVSGKLLLDLTIANPTHCGLQYPDGIQLALASASAHRYQPEPCGLIAAREAVCTFYASRSTNISPLDLILTAGSSEAYSFIFRLLCEPGDAILVPVPSYPLFEFLAQINDVRAVPYRLAYDGEWHIDLQSLIDAAGGGAKAAVIVSPNNPTGNFLKADELQSVNKIAARCGMALIVDEVFSEYALADDNRRVNTTAVNTGALTFTLNGISKLAGLPQLKLGWIVVSGPKELKREAHERLEIIADTFLSVNTPVQVALPELLVGGEHVRQQIRRRTKDNLEMLKSSIGPGSSCTLLDVEGGWYATIRVPQTRSDEEWALTLLDVAGVYAHPGYFFDFTNGGHIVVSLLTPEDEFKSGIKKLLSIIT